MTDRPPAPTVAAVHVWPADAATPTPLTALELDLGGPVGDRHHGMLTRAESRQKRLYPPGAEIRNNRQVSVVDLGELEQVARALGIDALAPGTIADNICTRGVEGLSQLAPTTRLVFEGGAVVVVYCENLPCTTAGELVAARYGTPPSGFPKAAMGLRGVVGWVEHPGVVRPGAAVTVVPPQRGG